MKKPTRKVSELRMLQQIVGALVSRHGGHVEISHREIDGAEGDRIEMVVGPHGVVLHLHRAIKVVSSLN